MNKTIKILINLLYYCRICGKWKANEKFSGKGHAAHICKECDRLPIERKNELQRLNRVGQLIEKYRLTKEEWDLLEKYAKNRNYPELREFAAGVLELHRERREARKLQIGEIAYSDMEEELKEEISEILYDDLLYFIAEKDAVPDEKQLNKITANICTAYLKNFHLRILPDSDWNGKVQEVLKTVIADLKEDSIEPEG